MATNTLVRYTKEELPDKTALEIWKHARGNPTFTAVKALVAQELERQYDTYVSQPASEFNRGQVIALKNLLHFFNTGEL